MTPVPHALTFPAPLLQPRVHTGAVAVQTLMTDAGQPAGLTWKDRAAIRPVGSLAAQVLLDCSPTADEQRWEGEGGQGRL